MTQRIHIIGAGAIGSLVGGRLAQAFGRESVVLIDVDEAHVRAVQDRGLRIFTCGRPTPQCETVAVDVTTPETIEKAALDKVITATKAYSNSTALKGLRRDIPLLVLQNGYDESLDEFTNAVRGVEFGFACQVMEPGCIFNATVGRYVLGGRGGFEMRAAEWAARLNKAGIKAAVTESIEGWLWSRLLVGSALSPVGAIHGESMRDLMSRRESRRLVQALFTEGCPIVRRRTAELRQKLRGMPGPPCIVNWILRRPILRIAAMRAAAAQYGEFESSMLHDVRRNRCTEIDYINGAIVRLARSYGIDTPRHDWVCTQIRTLTAASQQMHAPQPFRIDRQGVHNESLSGVAGGNDLYTGD